MDEKERLRAERRSPVPPQVNAIDVLAPGWNTSDVWRAVPMTDEDLAMVSRRDQESYRRRREEKLSTETQAVQSLRATDALLSLLDHQPSGSRGANDPSVVNESLAINEIAAPSWLSDRSSKSMINAPSQSRSMRSDETSRRVGDYDTRFDQSVISNLLSHNEILADHRRWSGVSRPAKLPLGRSMTAGFTPSPLARRLRPSLGSPPQNVSDPKISTVQRHQPHHHKQ